MEALKAIEDDKDVIILSDSAYVVNSINKWLMDGKERQRS